MYVLFGCYFKENVTGMGFVTELNKSFVFNWVLGKTQCQKLQKP